LKWRKNFFIQLIPDLEDELSVSKLELREF